MKIRHKEKNGMVYTVYGTSREVQVMPQYFQTNIFTWFLVWEPAPVGYESFWKWVNGDEYEPYIEE